MGLWKTRVDIPLDELIQVVLSVGSRLGGVLFSPPGPVAGRPAAVDVLCAPRCCSTCLGTLLCSRLWFWLTGMHEQLVIVMRLLPNKVVPGEGYERALPGHREEQDDLEVAHGS